MGRESGFLDYNINNVYKRLCVIEIHLHDLDKESDMTVCQYYSNVINDNIRQIIGHYNDLEKSNDIADHTQCQNKHSLIVIGFLDEMLKHIEEDFYDEYKHIRSDMEDFLFNRADWSIPEGIAFMEDVSQRFNTLQACTLDNNMVDHRDIILNLHVPMIRGEMDEWINHISVINPDEFGSYDSIRDRFLKFSNDIDNKTIPENIQDIREIRKDVEQLKPEMYDTSRCKACSLKSNDDAKEIFDNPIYNSVSNLFFSISKNSDDVYKDYLYDAIEKGLIETKLLANVYFLKSHVYNKEKGESTIEDGYKVDLLPDYDDKEIIKFYRVVRENSDIHCIWMDLEDYHGCIMNWEPYIKWQRNQNMEPEKCSEYENPQKPTKPLSERLLPYVGSLLQAVKNDNSDMEEAAREQIHQLAGDKTIPYAFTDDELDSPEMVAKEISCISQVMPDDDGYNAYAVCRDSVGNEIKDNPKYVDNFEINKNTIINEKWYLFDEIDVKIYDSYKKAKEVAIGYRYTKHLNRIEAGFYTHPELNITVIRGDVLKTKPSFFGTYEAILEGNPDLEDYFYDTGEPTAADWEEVSKTQCDFCGDWVKSTNLHEWIDAMGEEHHICDKCYNRIKKNPKYDEPSGFWGKSGAGILPYCPATKRYLINLRSIQVNEPGTWGVWSGRLEDGEMPEEGALRELEEETGYRAKMQLQELDPFYAEQSDFVFYNFLGIVPEEFKPDLNWESEDAKWVTLKELVVMENLHFGLKNILDGMNIDPRDTLFNMHIFGNDVRSNPGEIRLADLGPQLHLGKNPVEFSKEEDYKVENLQRCTIKPEGHVLWTSSYREDIGSDWLSFIKEHKDSYLGYRLRKHDAYKCVVKDDIKIAEVDSLEDLVSIVSAYPNRSGGNFIDWHVFSKDYDGLHLTKKGQIDTDPGLTDWGPFEPHLPGWDIESTVFFRSPFRECQKIDKNSFQERSILKVEENPMDEEWVCPEGHTRKDSHFGMIMQTPGEIVTHVGYCPKCGKDQLFTLKPYDPNRHRGEENPINPTISNEDFEEAYDDSYNKNFRGVKSFKGVTPGHLLFELETGKWYFDELYPIPEEDQDEWYFGDDNDEDIEYAYESKEDFIDGWNFVINELSKLPKKIEIWRAVYSRSRLDTLTTDCPGLYWSTTEDSALYFGLNHTKHLSGGHVANYLFHAEIDQKDVDWIGTIFAQFAFQKDVDEIRLKNACLPEIIDIFPLEWRPMAKYPKRKLALKEPIDLEEIEINPINDSFKKEMYLQPKNPSLSNFRQWLKRNFSAVEFAERLDSMKEKYGESGGSRTTDDYYEVYGPSGPIYYQHSYEGYKEGFEWTEGHYYGYYQEVEDNPDSYLTYNDLSKKVKNNLIRGDLKALAIEAKKYSTFEEFEKGFLWELNNGHWYHITDDRNFKIKKDIRPTDYSTMTGPMKSPKGLMITSNLETPAVYGMERDYVALLDVSKIPPEHLKQIGRGFGNEVFIPSEIVNKIKVRKLMMIKEAQDFAEEYDKLLEIFLRSDDLKEFYEDANKVESNPDREQIIRSKAFKNWFGDWENSPETASRVVDDDGEPLMVYHGTTHEFHEFTDVMGNVENFIGMGYYFTDSLTDAEHNYLSAGADLTGRIEIAAGRLMSDEDIDEDEAYRMAKEKYMGGSEIILDCYLNIRNPLRLYPEGTFFNPSMKYDEEYEEYFEEEDEGEIYAFREAVRQTIRRTDKYDVWNFTSEDIINFIRDKLPEIDFEGAYAYDIYNIFKINIIDQITDFEGNLAGHEFIREVFEKMGYDGVIIDADMEWGNRSKWKTMVMDYGTKHYVAFNSTQIKLADGSNVTFDPEDPSIKNPIKSKQQWEYLASQKPEMFRKWQKEYPGVEYEDLPKRAKNPKKYYRADMRSGFSTMKPKGLYDDIYNNPISPKDDYYKTAYRGVPEKVTKMPDFDPLYTQLSTEGKGIYITPNIEFAKMFGNVIYSIKYEDIDDHKLYVVDEDVFYLLHIERDANDDILEDINTEINEYDSEWIRICKTAIKNVDANANNWENKKEHVFKELTNLLLDNFYDIVVFEAHLSFVNNEGKEWNDWVKWEVILDDTIIAEVNRLNKLEVEDNPPTQEIYREGWDVKCIDHWDRYYGKDATVEERKRMENIIESIETADNDGQRMGLYQNGAYILHDILVRQEERKFNILSSDFHLPPDWMEAEELEIEGEPTFGYTEIVYKEGNIEDNPKSIYHGTTKKHLANYTEKTQIWFTSIKDDAIMYALMGGESGFTNRIGNQIYDDVDAEVLKSVFPTDDEPILLTCPATKEDMEKYEISKPYNKKECKTEKVKFSDYNEIYPMFATLDTYRQNPANFNLKSGHQIFHCPYCKYRYGFVLDTDLEDISMNKGWFEVQDHLVEHIKKQRLQKWRYFTTYAESIVSISDPRFETCEFCNKDLTVPDADFADHMYRKHRLEWLEKYKDELKSKDIQEVTDMQLEAEAIIVADLGKVERNPKDANVYPDSYYNYFEQIDNGNFQPLTDKIWETLQIDGFPAETEIEDKNKYGYIELEISKKDGQGLKDFDVDMGKPVLVERVATPYKFNPAKPFCADCENPLAQGDIEYLNDIEERIYYHGTSKINAVDIQKYGLKKGKDIPPERKMGGRDEDYYGISLSKDKNTASIFCLSGRCSIFTIVLDKGTKVVERPTYTDSADITKEEAQLLLENGVDGVKIGNWNEEIEKEIFILNLDVINIVHREDYKMFNKPKFKNMPIDRVEKFIKYKVEGNPTNILYHLTDNPNFSPEKDFENKQQEYGTGLYLTTRDNIRAWNTLLKGRKYAIPVDISSLRILNEQDIPDSSFIAKKLVREGYDREDIRKVEPIGDTFGVSPYHIALRRFYAKQEGYDGIRFHRPPEPPQIMIFPADIDMGKPVLVERVATPYKFNPISPKDDRLQQQYTEQEERYPEYSDLLSEEMKEHWFPFTDLWYDDCLRKPDYCKRAKGVTWEIKEIEPLEYFNMIDQFDMDKIKRELQYNNYVDLYAQKMEQGYRFPMIMVQYMSDDRMSQEGRHRALAAYGADLDKMPVLVINREVYDNPAYDEVKNNPYYIFHHTDYTNLKKILNEGIIPEMIGRGSRDKHIEKALAEADELLNKYGCSHDDSVFFYNKFWPNYHLGPAMVIDVRLLKEGWLQHGGQNKWESLVTMISEGKYPEWSEDDWEAAKETQAKQYCYTVEEYPAGDWAYDLKPKDMPEKTRDRQIWYWDVVPVKAIVGILGEGGFTKNDKYEGDLDGE